MSTLSRRDFVQLSAGGVIASLLTGDQDLVNMKLAAKNFMMMKMVIKGYH